MAGVLTIMSSSKRTYALQSELSELQENARFVMDELARDIRIAGYKGCRSDLDPKDAETNVTINLGPPFGINFNSSSVNNRNILDENGNVVSFPQSDALVISSFSEPLQAAEVTPAQFKLGDTTITLHSRSIVPDQSDRLRNLLVVSDCGSAAVYNVTSTGTNPITIEPPLLRDYLQPVSIFMVASAVAYEVKSIAGGGFALFRCQDRDNDGTCPEILEEEYEELFVEGVENMQVRYGIDTAPTDGIPNQYNPTPALGPNDRVVSVRISLLMRTNNKRGDLEGATDKEFHLAPDLTYAGNAVNPGPYNPHQDNGTRESGYRHRMFTSTIKVRN
jgi:type IV pilus assembly protein PilW